ncbi:methyl-coenzyme M reductase, gamma subunit [Methanocella conradii HZ254]|uniref:Methyl-coenzyme M reductase subunit gamma n=1 Tax=Methanocella conradii (strain DSM 24694 / JCM 17849 / CGMCC 1.5162 / HZ254) TaxID=1041930 RepID=H8I4B0_METCZ|nr:coenzyme-B sulfoethylthiotransferase subunit gamma [Methanocella conradii]AFC99667.1 methyl-coenzyme M reductase, gamma subunit [Methanocella conradii HZ254]
MAYKPQFYPGKTSVAQNRKKFMDPSYKMEKIRSLSDDDVVLILGHRTPGSAYKTCHPPLKESGEPDDPIRKIVEPIPGAAAGDRIRYIQFTDSMYFAPMVPYLRSWMACTRYRGVDPGTLSGRQIIETRERDLEKIAKETMETEMYDAARTGYRGCTVHGHSLRLNENGMMFDMLQRVVLDKNGNVYGVKNQVGDPLDRKINLGKPMSDEELKKRTTIYRIDGVPFRSDAEVVGWVQRIHNLRTKCGFAPKL